jgi:hypothetical protein
MGKTKEEVAIKKVFHILYIIGRINICLHNKRREGLPRHHFCTGRLLLNGRAWFLGLDSLGW